MKRNKGFTLAEIMLVIAILGILVSVVLPRLTGRTQEARAQTTRLQLENLGAALDAFELDCGRYPSSDEGLDALRVAPRDATGWRGPYLKKAVPADAWKNSYVYVFPGRHNTDYDLYSRGPDQQDGTNDDIGNW